MSGRGTPATELWPNDVLAQGTLLHGYRITRILGRGGFGVTYLAEDVLGQGFAIKEYFPRQFAVRQGAQVHAASAEDAEVFDDCRERFVYEARALVSLGQNRSFRDDIVKVQTFFEANGTAYMVMEYVLGRSLQAALRERPGGMAEAELRPLMINVLSGLTAVHEAGLMHRDIKPANILLREDGRPVLIDFGSSRDAGSQQTVGFTQIFSGGYAPPEQILGTRQAAFSDIYAAGMVFYEAIGGKVTDALARQQAAAAGMADPMPPAASVGAGRYAAALLAVIDMALALDPAARPASAAAMTRLIRSARADGDVGAGDTVIARAVPPPAPTRPPTTISAPTPHQGVRRRAALYAGAAAGAVGLAAVGWLLLVPPTPPAPVTPRPPVVSIPPVPIPPVPIPVVPIPPVPIPPVPTPPVPILVVPTPPPAPVVPPPVVPPPAPPAPETPAPALLAPAPLPAPVPQVVDPPPPFGLAEARIVARDVPCALIDITDGPAGTPIISGPVLSGAAFDAFLDELRYHKLQPRVTVKPLDPGHCAAIAAIGEMVRRSRAEGGLPLTLADAPVPVGGRLALSVQAVPGGGLYADLYGPDGSVRHLLRRILARGTAGAGGSIDIPIDATAPGPPGPHLLVVMTTPAPLDLAPRPASESTSVYLPALQRDLARLAQGTADPPRAEVAMLSVLAPPAPPPPPARPTPAAAPPSRAPNLNAGRCADIVARVQLGEALSDADRTVLRTQCKP